jgi:hypothetical protein
MRERWRDASEALETLASTRRLATAVRWLTLQFNPQLVPHYLHSFTQKFKLYDVLHYSSVVRPYRNMLLPYTKTLHVIRIQRNGSRPQNMDKVQCYCIRIAPSCHVDIGSFPLPSAVYDQDLAELIESWILCMCNWRELCTRKSDEFQPLMSKGHSTMYTYVSRYRLFSKECQLCNIRR